ncbi:hypothetical protein Hdeb2414_s0010g00358261 [Helianthus debilis subsp. tardiflorus]
MVQPRECLSHMLKLKGADKTMGSFDLKDSVEEAKIISESGNYPLQVERKIFRREIEDDSYFLRILAPRRLLASRKFITVQDQSLRHSSYGGSKNDETE